MGCFALVPLILYQQRQLDKGKQNQPRFCKEQGKKEKREHTGTEGWIFLHHAKIQDSYHYSNKSDII